MMTATDNECLYCCEEFDALPCEGRYCSEECRQDAEQEEAEARRRRLIIRPTTTGRTEAKPVKLSWFERQMTLADLIGTAGNQRLDDLANRLTGK